MRSWSSSRAVSVAVGDKGGDGGGGEGGVVFGSTQFSLA